MTDYFQSFSTFNADKNMHSLWTRPCSELLANIFLIKSHRWTPHKDQLEVQVCPNVLRDLHLTVKNIVLKR